MTNQQGYGYPGLQPDSAPPAYGYGVPHTPMAPNGAPLADFGNRLLARLIDGMVLGAISMVLAIPLMIAVFALLASSVDVADDGTSQVSGLSILAIIGVELLFVVVIFVVQYFYEVEYMRRSGQTIGKRVMKLKVVPLDPAWPLTRGMLVKRWGVQMLAGFVPGLGLLDGLWQLWDQPFRQCLHDKAAKTTVIKLPG